MPLFDYLCQECGATSEILVTSRNDAPKCASCGSQRLKKLLSAHSSMSGASKNSMPDPGNTACCGTSPSHAGCAGPGSCCGRGAF